MDCETKVAQNGWIIKSRTVHGLTHKYREYIVVKDGNSMTLGPFSTLSAAKRQAHYMNERQA